MIEIIAFFFRTFYLPSLSTLPSPPTPFTSPVLPMTQSLKNGEVIPKWEKGKLKFVLQRSKEGGKNDTSDRKLIEYGGKGRLGKYTM